MRTAIHAHHHEEFHLKHQAMWFLLMLMTLMLLLGRSVVATQWVIA